MNSLNTDILLVRMAQSHIEDADKLEAERAKAKEAAKKASEARRGSEVTGKVSVVDEFKAQYTVDDVLEKYEYSVDGGRVFDPEGKDIGSAKGDDRIKVFDSNDPLYTESGEGRHDAWGVEVVLGYKNNEGKAIAAWSKKLTLDDGETTVHEANVTALFPVLPDSPEGKKKAPLFRDYKTIEYTDPVYLIKPFIETLALVVLFAASGVGKTFLAISWLCAIVTGRDWNGHAVKQGKVFYMAGEDFNGVCRRVTAWESENQDIPPGALFISDHAVLLATDGQADYLIAEIQSAGVDEFALIVIDTLARCYGADENSTQDMSRFITVCDRIRLMFKCTVLLLHHTGVSDDSRGRGNSSLPAGADTVFRMEAKRHGIELTCTKAKNSAPPPKMLFRLDTVALGDGDNTSAVLVEDNGQHVFPDLSDLALNDFQTDIIDTLKSLGDGDSLGVPTLAELREATYAKWDAAGVIRDTSRQRFNRSIDKLKKLAAIKIDGDTDAGYVLLTVNGVDP